MITKARLAIVLSQLKLFAKPNLKNEQYPTDSEIAAEILWRAYMQGDIAAKIIADLGCGTGMLGIAALLLDAKFVYFADIDKDALAVLQQNLDKLNFPESKYKIINKDITKDITSLPTVETAANGIDCVSIDCVLQNPPFGTKQKHHDKLFLQTAFSLAPLVYSFHKSSTKQFIQAISKENGFTITHEFTTRFPLKQTMKFHKSRIKRIEVSCFRFVLMSTN